MFFDGTRPRVRAVLLAALLAAFVSGAQQATRNQEHTGPRATIDVVSQGYCINPEETQAGKNDRVGSVVFLLQVRIENMSERSMILCRDCIEVGSEPALLSVLPDGSPGVVLNGGAMYDGVTPRNRRHDPARPDERYLILKPHGAFSGNYKTGILVSYDSPTKPRTNLKPGKYFLRAEFGTWWPEARDTTGALRAKWKRYGDLYTNPLFPDPIPVQIEIPDRLPTCPLGK